MFDIWMGDIEFTTLVLIFSIVVLLPVQLLLCFKVRSKVIRLLPVVFLAILTIIFYMKSVVVIGWAGVTYIVLAVLSGFLLFMCGIGWGIWAITRLIIKNKMKLIITDLEDFNIPVEGEHKVIKPNGEIRHCIGCFGCWVKTPGKCVIHDGYQEIGIDMGKCSELIFVSRCCYGSVSPFVKMVQDRAISYIHPYFVMRKGEMHHKRRYKNVIKLSSHLYGENITDTEKETARELLKANADNYDGLVKGVYFYKSAEELEGVVL